MTLTAGTRLGHYEIRSQLGAGGMGEVYRARDSKLNREVAIKVLPEGFTEDAERVARFQREAQVLASLNHPNIAAIYGLEESDGVRALVMELVEGPTLADRIAAGPIPVDEAMAIAKQIAEALEVAHERGIIHRDLKPANVKVTLDGAVKVLDFGLAKVLTDDSDAADLSHSPTLIKGTQAGMILGTAAYMSPEQAKGKSVDKRSDIWAFGCLLFEMLTGKQTFSGETLTDTLAAVVRAEPDWDALPATTPGVTHRLLLRCLIKDQKRRLRDIGEARILFEEALSGPEDVSVATAIVQLPVRSRLWVGVAIAVAITGLATALVVRLFESQPSQPPVRKFAIPVPDLKQGERTPPVISPDGRNIVYVAGSSLWVRELDRLEPTELVSGVSPAFPFWSPDSNSIAYLANQKIWRVGVTGGQPAIVAQASFNLGGTTPGGVWTEDGKIVFVQAANGTGILSVSEQGGDFKEFLSRDEKSESDFHKPSLLPGGKGLLYIVDHNDGGPDTIEAWTGQTRKTILHLKDEFLDAPVYSPSGHILYRRNTGNPGIWALPFSLKEFKVTGEPFLVVADGSWPSVSSDGTLLYAEEGESSFQAVQLNRKGEVESTLGESAVWLRHPRFSPDGSRVALFKGEQNASGIFVTDLRSKRDVRLTFDRRLTIHPSWSPSGDRIYYESREGGARPEIRSLLADGSGKEEVLAQDGMQPYAAPDGKGLLFTTIVAGQGFELHYVPLEGDRKPIAFLEAPGNQEQPVFSPDGRYVAYQSNESGRSEIFLMAFPAQEGKWQVSTNGGATPRWDRTGKKLYFVQGESLMEVEVSTQPKLSLGTQRPLFSGAMGRLRLDLWYDVSPDGKTFAVVREAPGDKSFVHSLRLVENWYAEFKDKQKK
ncbi:MAG: protein kinase [Acidobacteriota bacterium]